VLQILHLVIILAVNKCRSCKTSLSKLNLYNYNVCFFVNFKQCAAVVKSVTLIMPPIIVLHSFLWPQTAWPWVSLAVIVFVNNNGRHVIKWFYYWLNKSNLCIHRKQSATEHFAGLYTEYRPNSIFLSSSAGWAYHINQSLSYLCDGMLTRVAQIITAAHRDL